MLLGKPPLFFASLTDTSLLTPSENEWMMMNLMMSAISFHYFIISSFLLAKLDKTFVSNNFLLAKPAILH